MGPLLREYTLVNFEEAGDIALTLHLNSVVGIGLSENPLRKNVKLEGYFPGMPPTYGWSGQIHSWAYQSIDGALFGSHSGKQEAKEGYRIFSTGDVIGCGFNAKEKTVFYTYNGERLGE